MMNFTGDFEAAMVRQRATRNAEQELAALIREREHDSERLLSLSRRTELLRESASLMHEAAMFLSAAVGIDMSRQLLNKVAAIKKELGDG